MKNDNKILVLNQNPFELFRKWFSMAVKKELNDPNAMNLSTVDAKFQPSSRMVLMKSFDKKGFVFNTNFNSKKGKNISNNNLVSLNFHWKSLRKQVRIEGKAIKISKGEADNLFFERPKESKIGAWASKQSEVLIKRTELEERVVKFEKKFRNKKILRPPNWSGYRVIPNLFEFWQDMPFRLHDRLEFKKVKSIWKIRKLYP